MIPLGSFRIPELGAGYGCFLLNVWLERNAQVSLSGQRPGPALHVKNTGAVSCLSASRVRVSLCEKQAQTRQTAASHQGLERA
jgi:hypothetical protein